MSNRGLKTAEANNVKYITMGGGDFVRRVKEPTKSSRERKLTKGVNTGNIVHEELFNEFTGQLVSIKVEHHAEYGSSWAFRFDVTVDSPEFLVLKVPYSSGYANNVLTRLPNISDISNDLTLKGYKFKPADKDKEIMGISIVEWQGGDGVKVIPFYTKEQPNGIPQMKQIKVKGKDVWDDSDRLEFLESMVNEQIIPNLPAVTITPTAPIETAPAAASDVEEMELDDNGEPLPF